MQHNDDDPHPKVGVGVMILKDGKVLIGKLSRIGDNEDPIGDGTPEVAFDKVVATAVWRL